MLELTPFDTDVGFTNKEDAGLPEFSTSRDSSQHPDFLKYIRYMAIDAARNFPF
jgi:hypothetical protein